MAHLAPGFATLLRYDRRWLSKDLLAGISVAAIALPVGLAYADLAGVPAMIGIYSAIFPLFAYALFSSLRDTTTGWHSLPTRSFLSPMAPLTRPQGRSVEFYLRLRLHGPISASSASTMASFRVGALRG
jgi:MFS superfamily sulfate permease-like transporter